MAIYGLYPWGTDGNFPKTEIDQLTIKMEDTVILVPSILIGDFFECDNNFKIYSVDDTFFVH